MRTTILALALGATGATGWISGALTSAAWAQAAHTPAPPAYVAAAVADHDRPQDDVDRDAARKPAELVAFARIRPGDRVADIMPGKGYFTRIFAKAVGGKGEVYAVMPQELADKAPKALDAAKSIPGPAFGNVSVLVQPTAGFAPPKPLDVAWTSQNYHDVVGFFGADKAAAMDAAVFKALKPGGYFIVIDHAAPAGSGATDATTLHRIDEAFVKQQVEAAGFRLDGESAVLRNPADGRDLKVFDPSIRGKTDQFVLRFKKPG
jgi:predicted methyltransferase